MTDSPNLKDSVSIQPIGRSDRSDIQKLLIREWGSVQLVTRGKIHLADELSGFIARIREELAGFLTYRIEGSKCEIVSLNSFVENVGVGSELLEVVRVTAKRNNCVRIWLITTNDNTPALRFYQKRGYRISAVYPNAIANSRKMKPEIPIHGLDSILIRDEIELEMILTDK